MPIVNVKMLKGRTVAMKRKLVSDITDVVTKDLAVAPDQVTVIVEEYEKENWAHSGKLYSDT